uniref:PiggyBac transposable element-derived protein domain-containing protein n=1 Tax=Graphocephala atropunctata TaxID=36148 RepID=A0A1B6LUY7_9HEMI
MDKPSTSQPVHNHDPDFSDRIRAMLDSETLDNISDDDSSFVDDSDADPDFVLEESDDSSGDLTPDDNELLEEEDTEEINIRNMVAEDFPLPKCFIERLRKNEVGPPNAWNSAPPPTNVRTPARNIIRTGLPGIRGPARALGNTPRRDEVWKLFFDEDIMTRIVTNTNVKLNNVSQNLAPGTNRSNYRNTDVAEINALIGLLLLSSVLKSNDEKIQSLFTKDWFSRPIFRATMSVKRFDILVGSLRFDNAQTRDQRKMTDKAAAISEIFSKFISNSQIVYCPSALVTIDEMLVPFRGRCSFRVYMPKKPKKYGVKVMCLADAKTSYLFNAYIYTGKGSDGEGLNEKEKNLSVPTQSLIKLCQPIQGSNRNVTADNWFSSLDGVEELEKRKLTYVGTLRKDKRAIPVEFLPNNERPVVSTLYGFRKNMTLLSFVPKKNKAVCLISTMHHTVETNLAKKKPEMISFYNSNKCGVDLLDMKCAVFSSSRKTRRWPLAIFYRLVNIGSVNSYITYMSYTGSTMVPRFDFIKSLGHELIVPHLQRRLAETPNLPRDLKIDIERILGNERLQAAAGVPDDRLEKRKTCAKCPPGSDRKTQNKCVKCHSAICGQCLRRVCLDCAQEYM